jgi:hypothetical protein
MPAPPHPRPCNHRHPGRSGNLYGVRRGRSASRRPARLRIPARCCPTGFSTPYPRSAVFRTSRIHFPRRSTCGESHGANAETAAQSLPDTGRNPDFNAWLETLAHACGVSASEAVVRTWSILYPYPVGSAGPISIVPDCPGETLAAYFAGTIRTSFVQMQNKC